jgi:GTP-binding protein
LKSPTARLARVCAAPSQLPPPSLPEVAVIGRSNVGKSSFVNAVLGRKGLIRVSSTPGRTREVLFVELPERGYLVDLPGYGFAKVPLSVKAGWKALVEAYLAREARGACCLLVDMRRNPAEGDLAMTEYFRRYGRPFFVVLTKADKVARGQWRKRSRDVAKALGLDPEQDPIPFSALTGEGLRTVRKRIEECME